MAGVHDVGCVNGNFFRDRIELVLINTVDYTSIVGGSDEAIILIRVLTYDSLSALDNII